MNKAFIQKIIVILTLFYTCTGCRAYDTKMESGTDDYAETTHEIATVLGEDDAADAEQAAELFENPARRDPENAKLLCLQSGDMKTLL